jgi:hypothetical protein
MGRRAKHQQKKRPGRATNTPEAKTRKETPQQMKKPNQARRKNSSVAKQAQIQSAPEELEKTNQPAAITLIQCYDKFRGLDFEDAMAEFYGLYELCKDNPAPEVQAIGRMVEAEKMLNRLYSRVENL